MPQEYCYHCGGELAEGAPPQLFTTKIPAAEPRPGEPCRCGEVIEEIGPKYRISGPWDSEKQGGGTVDQQRDANDE